MQKPASKLFLILKTSNRFTWIFSKVWPLLNHELTLSEYLVLDALIRLGPSSWKEVFDEIGHSAGSFSAFTSLKHRRLISANKFNRDKQNNNKKRWILTRDAEIKFLRAKQLVDQKTLEVEQCLEDPEQFWKELESVFLKLGEWGKYR